MIINPNRDFPIARKDLTSEDIFTGWIESVTRAINVIEKNGASGSGGFSLDDGTAAASGVFTFSDGGA